MLLLRISLDLNQSLVDVLKGSLLCGRADSIEPQQLWNASEQAQKQTIRAMIDLSQRIQAAAPIPRLLAESQRSDGASDASNLAIVVHPARSRASPSLFVNASPGLELPSSSTSESGHSPSSSFSALSPFAIASSYMAHSQSPFQSTPLLLSPMFPHIHGRTPSDLLREWKEDLDARSPSLLSPNSLTTNTAVQSPRSNIRRYSSAPDTPSFNTTSRPSRESGRSLQPSPSLSRPNLGLGIQDGRGNRIGSQRAHSDSYIPSSLASNSQEDSFLVTSMHSGFTHSLS